jgi:hypothetical protein
MDSIGAIILLIIAVVIYFLPFFVGSSKKNAGAIFMLNLFLGWTLIGWVVALVWAMTGDDEPQPSPQSKADKYDQLQKLEDLRTKGVLSTEEFIKGERKVMKA